MLMFPSLALIQMQYGDRWSFFPAGQVGGHLKLTFPPSFLPSELAGDETRALSPRVN